MKTTLQTFTFLMLILSFLSCDTKGDHATSLIKEFVPDDQELYDEIVLMDKAYFDAYNTCDLEKQAFIYADDLEFFHDKGGLMTSKEDLLKALEENICGKVTRELVKGSIEVYPIKDYGAVQIGYHKFHNKEEPGAVSRASKFIVMWKNDKENWKITKVISLH